MERTQVRQPVRIFALPLVLLALLLQAGAPVEAARMAARMLDPFAAMPICSSDKSQSRAPSEGQLPGERHDGHECGLCAACAPLHAAPAPTKDLVPALTLAEVGRPQFAVQASPRGSPLRRANARAPPLPLLPA